MLHYSFKMKELRKSKGLSQQELAKHINTTQDIVSNYERGKVPPNLDKLVEIASVLDVTLDELVEFKKIHHVYSKEIKNNIEEE